MISYVGITKTGRKDTPGYVVIASEGSNQLYWVYGPSLESVPWHLPTWNPPLYTQTSGISFLLFWTNFIN